MMFVFLVFRIQQSKRRRRESLTKESVWARGNIPRSISDGSFGRRFFHSGGPATMKSVKFSFTLLELLIVIGIIGALTAFLLPALHRARQHAQTAACANLQKQTFHLLSLYAAHQKSISILSWSEALVNVGLVDSENHAVLRCPAWSFPEDSMIQVFGMRRINGDLHSFNRVKNPSLYVWLADSIRNDSTEHPWAQKQFLSFYGDTGPYMNAVHYRHNRNANVVFADGSARNAPFEDLAALGCPKYVY